MIGMWVVTRAQRDGTPEYLGVQNADTGEIVADGWGTVATAINFDTEAKAAVVAKQHPGATVTHLTGFESRGPGEPRRPSSGPMV